jgi:hypothetical protein
MFDLWYIVVIATTLFSRSFSDELQLWRDGSDALDMRSHFRTKVDIINHNEMHSSAIIALLEYIAGPYTFDFEMTANASISQCTDELDRIECAPAQVPALHIHDDLAHGNVFTIDSKMALNNFELREFIAKRYRVKVTFHLSSEYKNPILLKWAHFRGNLRLVDLDDHGSILHPGDEIVQHTFAGHLFVSLRVANKETGIGLDAVGSDKSLYDVSNEEFVNSFEFHRINGLYFIPAVVDEDVLYEIHPNDGTEHGRNYRDKLLQYWEFQRLSQLNLQLRYLPSLPLDSKEESKPTALWIMKTLPQDLSARLRDHHIANSEKGYRTNEPPISMVFNQHSSNTRYVPLNDNDMVDLIQIIRQYVLEWLHLEEDELELTGFYGCREYTSQAIIRWHVDPHDSQPVTAIIHIADNLASKTDSWGLQLPRNLIQDKNFIRFSTVNDNANRSAWMDYAVSEDVETIYFNDGDILLIQSAKVPHARVIPLTSINDNDSWYANAFIHFATRGWKERDIVDRLFR